MKSHEFSRRQCLRTFAAAVGCGYAAILDQTRAEGNYGKFSLNSKVSAFPVHAVLIKFQYQVTACCAYYQGNGTYTQFPVKLLPNGRYIELFVTPPGEPEKSLAYVPGSEILAEARNARWDGTYERTSNPLPQGAKGVYSLRLQALTFRSMARIGNCKPPNAQYPSLQLDAAYTVLINGEQTPSLPAPYGSSKWSGQDDRPMNQQTIWTFDVS